MEHHLKLVLAQIILEGDVDILDPVDVQEIPQLTHRLLLFERYQHGNRTEPIFLHLYWKDIGSSANDLDKGMFLDLKVADILRSHTHFILVKVELTEDIVFRFPHVGLLLILGSSYQGPHNGLLRSGSILTRVLDLGSPMLRFLLRNPQSSSYQILYFGFSTPDIGSFFLSSSLGHF